MSLINHRNKPKLAFIIQKPKPLWQWGAWGDGLYGAIRVLSTKFHVKVFGYSEYPAIIQKPQFDIQLVDNVSSLQYWLNSFKSNDIVLVGSSGDSWKEVARTPGNYYLIHEGNTYAKKVSSFFKRIMVKSPSELQHFPNAVVAVGTNTELFKDLSLNRILPSFYPFTDSTDAEYDLWADSVPAGSLSTGEYTESEAIKTKVSGHLLLPSITHPILAHLHNHAVGVCLTTTDSDIAIERALEAMACNTPVLTTQNNRALELDGVWTCPPEVNQIRQAYLTMILSFNNSDVNLYEEYIKDKHDEATYAKAIQELL